MPTSVKLPYGFRPWRDSNATSLREGYQFALLEDCDNAYRFTALADVDKIEAIFYEYAGFLPEEAFFILEYYSEDGQSDRSSDAQEPPVPNVFYSPYLPTDFILRTVVPYLERLIHDGFVGFGLANNHQSLEFFYSEEKFLTYFTDNHLRLSTYLSHHNIFHAEPLKLPTDCGHHHLSLLNIDRQQLPEKLRHLHADELNSALFCQELCELLDMYQVEEGLSFFLTRKEQIQIAELIKAKLPQHEFSDVDFGGLLLDWSDFVTECEQGFDGDLWEYRQGLRIRDAIQMVIEVAAAPLADKISSIVVEPDELFRDILIDRRKRLDPPQENRITQERFWYQGMVGKPGSYLRRDLIRQDWFKH